MTRSAFANVEATGFHAADVIASFLRPGRSGSSWPLRTRTCTSGRFFTFTWIGLNRPSVLGFAGA
jgi:hypothetical protein